MLSQNKFILHITNDYTGSTVYKNLVLGLDRIGIPQIVYTAFRRKEKFESNHVEFSVLYSEILYSPILNYGVDRLFFPVKILKIIRDIESKIDFSNISIIHAHTWYSDGAVAYYLSLKYGIPYIISVRNTDINVFQKKLIYLNSFGRKIINKSRRVILISESYKEKFINLKSLNSIKDELKLKTLVIPNGVEKFWLENSEIRHIYNEKKLYNIVYVGKFDTNKNILNLQKAIIEINKSSFNPLVHLHLVGGKGDSHEEALNLIKKNPNFFTYHGFISDNRELKKIYNACDIFAMPSRHETFGLVYVEALLQGLPVLYTHGEGIDGFYQKNIGEKVFSFDSHHIAEKLYYMISNIEKYEIPFDQIKDIHDWDVISHKFFDIYHKEINRLQG